MSPILIIDPGHGGNDPGGGSNNYWKEKELNLRISLYQYERYQALGVPVAITRKTDKSLSSDERTRIVRESGAKYCHSNHVNAGGGDGAEIIHSIYSNGQMAQTIANELKAAGQNLRRVFTRTLPNNKNKDYYFMHRETGSVETNIIEYGFADSSRDDIDQLRNNWRDYAEAVVKGFCKHAGFDYRSPGNNGEVDDDDQQDVINNNWLHLPSSDNSWRVYPIGVAPVKGNEKGFLNPAKFGGLSYKIKGRSQQHVYIIETADFGTVQIYAHPNTGAIVDQSSEGRESDPSYVGKRVESKVDNLRFYFKPSWDDDALVNTIDKGVGFPTIVDKVKVGSGSQYKVKNSKGDVYYITANEQFVRVK